MTERTNLGDNKRRDGKERDGEIEQDTSDEEHLEFEKAISTIKADPTSVAIAKCLPFQTGPAPATQTDIKRHLETVNHQLEAVTKQVSNVKPGEIGSTQHSSNSLRTCRTVTSASGDERDEYMNKISALLHAFSPKTDSTAQSVMKECTSHVFNLITSAGPEVDRMTHLYELISGVLALANMRDHESVAVSVHNAVVNLNTNVSLISDELKTIRQAASEMTALHKHISNLKVMDEKIEMVKNDAVKWIALTTKEGQMVRLPRRGRELLAKMKTDKFIELLRNGPDAPGASQKVFDTIMAANKRQTKGKSGHNS